MISDAVLRFFCLKSDLTLGRCHLGRVPAIQSGLSAETARPRRSGRPGSSPSAARGTGHQWPSRSDMVSCERLARVAVGSTVHGPIGGNSVREGATTGVGGAGTGRPAQILSVVVPDRAAALGLGLGHDEVRAVLTDAVRTILWDRTRPTAVDDDPDRTLDTAMRLIDSALDGVGVPWEAASLGPLPDSSCASRCIVRRAISFPA